MTEEVDKKRRRESTTGEELLESDEDDSENGEPSGSKGKKAGRRKISIEFIEDKSRRHITFSKRKAGIMKKAYELSTLTGTQVLLLVASETGHVYTFATPKLQPLITKPEGKNLIQQCLNAQEGSADQSPPRYEGNDVPHHEVEPKREPQYRQGPPQPVSYQPPPLGPMGFSPGPYPPGLNPTGLNMSGLPHMPQLAMGMPSGYLNTPFPQGPIQSNQTVSYSPTGPPPHYLSHNLAPPKK